MDRNIGGFDRVARIVIGFALLGLLFLPNDYRWFGLIGLVPLATAVLRWCPLYRIFGVTTCRIRQS